MFYHNSMKNLLPLFLLLITLHDAMAVTVCSVDYPVSNGLAGCNADSGCQPVYDDTSGGEFLRCIPNCFDNSLNSQSACENYAGCEWNIDSGECRFFDGTTVTPAQYKTRIGDGANATIQTQVCPPDYPNITNIADSKDFCYKPCATGSDNASTTCGFSNDIFGQSGFVSCVDASSQILIFTDDYHAEGDFCYLNDRPCNLFNANDDNGSSISDDDKQNISGNAVYDETNHTYNVDSCYYTKTIRSDNNNSHNSNRWCDSENKYSVSNNTDASANTVLAFNNLNGYYCTACERESNTYPTNNTTGTQHCIAPASPYHKACKCIPIEAGQYGYCSNWNYSVPLITCQVSDCPVGQTTGNTGGTTINDCHYTNATKICVGTECISLQSMVSNGNQLNVSPNDWESN
jgi:hypothetical protein